MEDKAPEKTPSAELPPSEQTQPADQTQPSKPKSGGSGISFALILIGIGAVFLLNNMGLISISWAQAARFWPLLLIIIGLDIIVGRRSALGGALVGLATVGAIAGVIWFSQGPNAPTVSGNTITGKIHVPLEGAKRLKVVVDIGDLPLTLDAETDEKEVMVHGEYKSNSWSEPQVDYEMDGDLGTVTIKQPRASGMPFDFTEERYLHLHLPEGIPTELEVNSDLGQTTVDLTGLEITNLDVEAGSGQLNVTLPQQAEMDNLRVKADLGQVNVIAPDGAELTTRSFDVNSGSGQLNVTLPESGSLGEVHIEGDLGQVTVSAQSGGHVEMEKFTVKSGSGQLTVELPPDSDLGEVDIEGDLGQVQVEIPNIDSVTVSSFRVKSGSGAMSVVLPNTGQYEAEIESDLGAVEVEIPDGLEASLQFELGLGKVNIENGRLTQFGENAWRTDDTGADNSVQLTINGGSGAITIK